VRSCLKSEDLCFVIEDDEQYSVDTTSDEKRFPALKESNKLTANVAHLRRVFEFLASNSRVSFYAMLSVAFGDKDGKMKTTIWQLLIGGLFLATSTSVFSQSQALNGQIEGTVQDQAGAAVLNAVITATSVETGATRTLKTDESGVYHFPLLPLGSYRITAEAANFKKFVREGITLTTGQTATIDIRLQVGDIKETVTVLADTSIADAGKTDLGRVMNSREVQSLPLINRNPYNFGLLQINVTGRPSPGFHNTLFNANGFLRRVNYRLDGNAASQHDRRVRFLLISDVYVSEIQLVPNGFAAEFGETPGLILNVVTPSGTNKLNGAINYSFRRPPFSSRPFFYSGSDIPDNNADNFSATIGAPIIKNRWQFYFGYEYQHRDDDAGAAVRLISIRPEDRDRLIREAGLSPSIFVPSVPRLEKGSFYIFRSDLQLNKNNRLAVRFNHSDLNAENWIQGGLNTTERFVDAFTNDYALAVQLVSFTPTFFNEFRFQYGQRNGEGERRRNEFSGSRPSVTISGVANFGSPVEGDNASAPYRITQIQDNLTRTFSAHIVKFGGGFSFHSDTDRSTLFALYTFPSIDAYIAARNGTNPLSYTSFTEVFGDTSLKYAATFWNFFAQDDWKITRRLKINFGLRYDFMIPPKADATSPFVLSQKFNLDKNNFAPRLGIVYALREGTRPTVIRAGAGIYYDATLLAIYRDVIRINGNPRFFNVSFNGNNNGTTTPSPNAPAFPNTFGTLPVGTVLPRQNIYTIAPDFETMYTMQGNIQLEQAITENLSFAIGYIHIAGRHLAVYRNINRINPVRFLADGRPVFSTAFNATTRLDTRFSNIFLTESAGISRYDALTLQLTQRLSRGLQFSANYTLSKSTDDAPDLDLEGWYLSDPTNRSLDRGLSSADQRHTFAMSMVFQPRFNSENKTLRSLSGNNQFGIIARANSGERFNIYCNCDLNRDGTLSDRSVGIRRNSGKTPPQYNVDLRYSRFFNFKERFKLEVFGEFTNLFNVNSIVTYRNTVVTTNTTTGELIGTLPDFRARNQNTSQDSRQFQIGFKFIF